MPRCFLLFLLFLQVAIFGCKNSSTNHSEEISAGDSLAMKTTPSDGTQQVGNETPNDSLNVEVKTFQEKNQWGYDIFIDGKMYIHQPNIPSVPGNSGFKSEADAKKAGEFVAYKIHHHIMPPSVTPEELDSMGLH